ncbi:MAG: CHAP domain-containing protein [Candidatus Taylorbacteria bacterium]|nr:CHAP domain-containing protein [Candidatus Taylorbacteria bacterium]
MPNWLKNLISLLANISIQTKSVVEKKSIEILPAFTAKTLYVNSEIGLNVRSLPDATSEKLGAIPHGSEVAVLNEQGKWFEVRSGNLQGWVSSVYLMEEKPIEHIQRVIKEDVSSEFPQFRIAIANLADDANTTKLRKIINDEFGGGANSWELQCTEYVCYKLRQMGVHISWPAERPRHGGRWADIFERHGLYKVLTEPKIGCAMCFTTGFRSAAMNDTGHVAFVEQVLDNGSVRISEANWPPPGKYNERVMPVSEWQDKYKCRFVDFS